MNHKIFWKRAAFVLPALAIVILLIWEEDKSPIGRLLDWVTNSPTQLWLAAIAIFVVVIASVVWMFTGLIPKKTQNDVKKITAIGIAIGFSQLMIVSQAQAMVRLPGTSTNQIITSVIITNDNDITLTQEEQAQVELQTNQAIQIALKRLAENPRLTKTTVTTKALLETAGMIALIVVIVAVIAGIIYVGYKLYKTIMKIGEKRKKDIDDGDNKTNSASASVIQSLDSDISGIWAASLFRSWTNPTLEDLASCNCEPPFSFSFVVPITMSEPVQLFPPYFPYKTNMVSIENFYAKHGLSTNLMENSYSVNGKPVSNPSIITYDGVTTKITFNGATNTVVVVERSPDLFHWEEAGRLYLPRGTFVSFGDSETSAKAMFYRVQTQE